MIVNGIIDDDIHYCNYNCHYYYLACHANVAHCIYENNRNRRALRCCVITCTISFVNRGKSRRGKFLSNFIEIRMKGVKVFCCRSMTI